MDIILNHPFELSSLRFEKDANVVEIVATEEMRDAWQKLLDSARELEQLTPDL
jgi:hypothetical protein